MKKIYILTLLALLVTACNVPMSRMTNPMLSGGFDGPQTWIDAPLNNMHIPLAPYEVVFHATDNSGVTGVELSINDQIVALPAPSQLGGILVTVKYDWAPAFPGEYLLEARGRNAGGTWSDVSAARVWVGEITPSPVTTITPTITPTLPADSASFGQPVLSTTVFEYVYDCLADPEVVTIMVDFSSAGSISKVYFFYRLRNLSTNTLSAWNDGLNMTESGGGTYQIIFSSRSIPNVTNLLKGASAEFQYQFVASAPGGEAVVRSAVFTNIQLVSCH